MLISLTKMRYLLGGGRALPTRRGPPEGLEAALEAAAAGHQLGPGGHRVHQPLEGGQEWNGGVPRYPTMPWGRSPLATP